MASSVPINVVTGIETPGLVRWRHASSAACSHIRFSASLFEEFLESGGPDAIKGLKATIKKLRTELAEVKGNSQVVRYKALQQDLKERDAINKTLRSLLLYHYSVVTSDAELDRLVDQKNIKEDRLYGASRELLLRENKQLRSLLEAHLVTTRTSRVTASHNLAGQSFAQGDDDVAAGGAARGDQSPPSAGYATGSHNQVQGQSRVAKTGPATARTGNRVLPAALMPHMEVVRGLAEAGRELEAAESSYGLPQMHHAASQADDGSLGHIDRLESQVAILAGQKSQLIHKVSDLEATLLAETKAKAMAMQEADHMRRLRNDILMHNDDLSQQVKDHLKSEEARANRAEAQVAATQVELRDVSAQLHQVEINLSDASAQLAVANTALEIKEAEVDTMQRLYDGLRAELGQVGGTHRDMESKVLSKLEALAAQQAHGLSAAVGHAAEAHAAAAAGHATLGMLANAHVALTAEVEAHRTATLQALEGQLAATRQSLSLADHERRQAQRQMVAGQLLGRLQDQRMDKALAKLRADVPEAVAARVGGEIGAMAARTEAAAAEMSAAAAQLGQPPESGTADVSPGPDDETSRLLMASRALRADLHTLMAAEAATPAYGDGNTNSNSGPLASLQGYSLASLVQQPVVQVQPGAPHRGAVAALAAAQRHPPPPTQGSNQGWGFQGGAALARAPPPRAVVPVGALQGPSVEGGSSSGAAGLRQPLVEHPTSSRAVQGTAGLGAVPKPIPTPTRSSPVVHVANNSQCQPPIKTGEGPQPSTDHEPEKPSLLSELSDLTSTPNAKGLRAQMAALASPPPPPLAYRAKASEQHTQGLQAPAQRPFHFPAAVNPMSQYHLHQVAFPTSSNVPSTTPTVELITATEHQHTRPPPASANLIDQPPRQQPQPSRAPPTATPAPLPLFKRVSQPKSTPMVTHAGGPDARQ